VASVIGKKVGGRTYYYLAHTERVNGKPRITSQRYLGTADDIAAAVDGAAGAAASPDGTRHLAFGDVAAVWATLERLQVRQTIDAVLGTRTAKVSVGTHLVLSVLHRVTAPGIDLARWWAGSAASRFVRPRIPVAAVHDDEFWRVTRRLTRAQLERIEEAVSARVRDHLGDPRLLAVDVPNFATYAESETAVAAPAGLTAVVTRDGAIPLASAVYPREGAVPFGVAAERLAARVDGPVTLVFETGQHAQLDLDDGRRFVGALPLGDYPELLARPASARRPVDPDRFAGVTALDTHAVVSGATRRVILTHSAKLHAAQARGFAQALSSATRQLDGLALALAAGTNRRSRDQVLTEIARITRVRWVDRVLSTRLTGSRPADLRLEWRADEAARARLDEEFFGKQLLVTDHDWPVADVITAYRARYHLDSTFRRLNGPFVAASAPRRYWTEQRIAVHSLVSVLATVVTHVMRQEADRAGLDLSVRELLDQLARIGETVLRYPSTGGRPRTRRLLTCRDPVQQRLFDLFELGVYAP